MPAPSRPRRTAGFAFVLPTAIVLAGTLIMALHVESVLRDPELARGLLGTSLWGAIVRGARGTIVSHGSSLVVDVPVAPVLLSVAAFSMLTWLAGAAWISRRRAIPYREALCLWGRWGWLWWLLPAIWELLETGAALSASMALDELCRRSLPLWQSLLWAGWLTTFIAISFRTALQMSVPAGGPRIPSAVWGTMAAYFLCFATMNWMLYEALQTPHGDSAMYEEHVWNLLHGKGFRSYLDGGRLFLGEHIQVIHLFVIPLYIFWPSHLLLELCQSGCLALGAIPVYRIAMRHSGSQAAATLLALAYLLYFPMQFLDIAIDYKTFRPNSFEIPLMLMALDALESSRYRWMLVWLAGALLCQEDAAPVIAPLGVWVALRQARDVGIADRFGRRRLAWFGSGLALFAVVYLVVVIKFALPWFRGGQDVHFARYFPELGETTSAIVANLAMHPGRFLATLLNADSAMFALQLVVPLGFLPLLSPGRVAVAAPLFGVLCLSEITHSPFHHFHAPLIAVLFWSAAAGLGTAPGLFHTAAVWWNRRSRNGARNEDARHRIDPERFATTGKSLPAVGLSVGSDGAILQPAAAQGRRSIVTTHAHENAVVAVAVWCALNAFLTGLPIGLSPLGIGFWDPAARVYWRHWYIPGERARRFAAVFALIPRDARVASTDFIHPRFTHHERSYDYSAYRPIVPDDTDYIVIDTRHPYSGVKRPEEVKEYRDEPDKWELVHDDGYFIVLKRIDKTGSAAFGR